MSARFLLACLLLAAPFTAYALDISGFRFDARQFDPSKGEQATVRFVLSAPATVELRVWDGRDLLIRTISSGRSLPAGENALVWDGRDSKGRPVPAEAYRVTLQATGIDGQTVHHDLSDTTGGQTLTVDKVNWDADAGVVRYRLPKPARVNLRAGMQNDGPLLRTIIDWVPRPSGEQAEAWDGWDASRVLDLRHHPKLQVSVDAFALSENTLLVGPPPSQVQLITDLTADTPRRERAAIRRKLMHEHSQQSLEERGDVAITLTLPANLPRDKVGVPLASGLVPIRLDVADKDRQRMLDRRIEPVFFVDGTFAFENEVGFLPTTWIWNTETANEGEHYISANVRGYEGNFGMATIKVRVVRAPAKAKGSQ